MTASAVPPVPTPERPLLIGLLVDVSGSMTSSIQNRSGQTLNRLQSFQHALGDLIDYGTSLAKTGPAGDVSALFRLFAYGFGFGNPLASLLGRGGRKVRDLLEGVTRDTTLGIEDLAKNWPRYLGLRAYLEARGRPP